MWLDSQHDYSHSAKLAVISSIVRATARDARPDSDTYVAIFLRLKGFSDAPPTFFITSFAARIYRNPSGVSNSLTPADRFSPDLLGLNRQSIG
jgi:hypothetical protein